MTIDTGDRSLSFYASANTQISEARQRLRAEGGTNETDGLPDADRLSQFMTALGDYLNARLGARVEEEADGDDFIRAQGSNAAIDAGGGNNRVIVYDGAGVRSGANDDRISAYDDATIDAGDGDNIVDTYQNASIRTGDGNDTIDAYDNARIASGAGDDVISVYDNATIWADRGNNRIDAYDNASIRTGDGDDTVSVYDNARIETGAGNDTVRAYGNATALLGAGNDRATAGDNGRLDGGEGADWLSAGKNAQIFGGDGDDALHARDNAILDGGAGNDMLYAFRNALVQGGTGDDRIDVGGGSTILFARGDGRDTLLSAGDRTWGDSNFKSFGGPSVAERYGGLGTSSIQLADGIAEADIRIDTDGDDLVIRIADTEDSLTVAGGNKGAAVPSVAFADGTVWTSDQVLARAGIA